MTPISERQRARFYTIKIGKNCETFIYIYSKSQTLFKKQDNFRYDSIHKNPDTLRYAIFMKFWNWPFYIQKAWHFALCDVLIYKKHDTSKIQDNLRYVFNTPDTLCYAIFLGILEIGGGGGIYINKKQCTLR